MEKTIKKVFGISINTTKKNDLFFLIGFGLFLFLQIIRYSNFYDIIDEIIFDCAFSICFLFFGLHFLFNYLLVNYKTVFYFILMVVIIAVITLLDGWSPYENQLVYIVFIFFMGKDVDINKIFRVSIAVTLFALIFLDIISRIGIIENDIYISAPPRPYRMGMGHKYTLYAPTYAFNVSAMFIYLRKNKIKWYELVILLLFNTYYYASTNSRLCFGLSVLLIIVAAFMKIFPNFPNGKKLLHLLAVALYPICAGISMWFAYFYDGSISWMGELNSMIEGRLGLAFNKVADVGIGLLGKQIGFIGATECNKGIVPWENYDYVDNLYVQTALLQGLIISAILLVIHVIAVYRAWKTRDYFLELILCILALHALIDDLIFRINFNIFWLAALSMVFVVKSRVSTSHDLE